MKIMTKEHKYLNNLWTFVCAVATHTTQQTAFILFNKKYNRTIFNQTVLSPFQHYSICAVTAAALFGAAIVHALHMDATRKYLK